LGIVTEYPLWFVLFCLLLGGLYSFFFYFRSRKDDIRPLIVRLMAFLRFVTVTIIAFLLLSPLVRKNSEIVEKPVIILAQDNSASIILSKDSAFYRREYPGMLEKLSGDLSGKFEVSGYSFGEKVIPGLLTSFTDKQTDISDLIGELKSRYYNRNVGALILASDGIYNKGSNPFYAAANLGFPVYTLALGDTLLVKDIIVRRALYNHSAFLGDKFPVEVEVDGNRCDNIASEITIERKGEVLFRKNITFRGEKCFRRIDAMIEAREKGLNRYTISIKPVEGEFSAANNRIDLFVDVTDTKQKVLILSTAPHPDIAAMRSALESSARFEVDEARPGELKQPAGRYDLIILYQLPAQGDFTDLSKITGSKTPLLYVLGTTTDYDAFNKLGTGLLVSSSKLNFTETLPYVNPDFTLFTLDKNDQKVINEFPPLQSFFGSFQVSPSSEVLCFQKIGNVQSRMPLVMFFSNGGRKTGVIAGENLWKWRLSDFLQKQNHDIFNDLVNKIAEYLAVKEDRNFLQVKTRNKWLENEPVEFEARLYNQSYELISDPDVSLTITDEKGKNYPFVFGKQDKSYYLNAGSFNPGIYKYQATAKVGNDTRQASGQFLVEPVNLEALNTAADHNLLYRVAKAHDGEMFYPGTMDQLEKKILAREDIRPVSFWQKKYSDLTGNLWVFLLVLALLTAEWFLRKRNGIY
jgi:hypothetical protein